MVNLFDKSMALVLRHVFVRYNRMVFFKIPLSTIAESTDENTARFVRSRQIAVLQSE